MWCCVWWSACIYGVVCGGVCVCVCGVVCLSCSLSFSPLYLSFPFSFPFFFSLIFLFLSSISFSLFFFFFSLLFLSSFSFSFALAPSLALALSLSLFSSLLTTKHFFKNRSTNTAANIEAFECALAQGKCTAVGSLPPPLRSLLPSPLLPTHKRKEEGKFYYKNISGEEFIFYYSFKLIPKNRRRVKLQALQFKN